MGDLSDPKAMAKKIHDMVLRFSVSLLIEMVNGYGPVLLLYYRFNKIQHILCGWPVGC